MGIFVLLSMKGISKTDTVLFMSERNKLPKKKIQVHIINEKEKGK